MHSTSPALFARYHARSIVAFGTALLCVAGSSAGRLSAASPPTPPAAPYEALLSTDAIGVGALRASVPLADGRGVVLAVLDTGVDPSAPGLQTTSTGEPKLIGVRDFSGQGHLETSVPESSKVGERPALRAGDEWLVDYEAAAAGKPPEDLRVAWIRESGFKGSDVTDIDVNGHSDGVFGVLLVPRAEDPSNPDHARWTAWVDTDGDRELGDETPIVSYELGAHVLRFGRFDPATKKAPVAFTLYIAPDGKHIELCFDDGGHGTHVAGIATGHSLEGKTGFDGIAPGAQILALKIGNNALAGGATTPDSKRKALEYAAKWAVNHDRAVVVNLSYGIGSEVEGAADIDRVVTRLLREHPYRFFVATSAGNSGPGISTVGQPAASALAFTAGALLTEENARALYGSRTGRDRVFSFSSRGGETSKPEAILPGVAWSSVPPFMSHNVMAGTSMASPQAAGAIARLVSAAAQQKLPVHNGMVRRALRFSAKKLDGYTAIDQGGGVVQLGEAWKSLQRLARSEEAQSVVGFETSTNIPTLPGLSGPCPYWRVGAWVPTAPHEQSVTVTPLFPTADTDSGVTRDFFGTYRLEPTASWIRLPSDRLQIRGSSGEFELTVDPKLAKSPGLHVAEVLGIPAESGLGREQAAFSVPVTIVIPHQPARGADWTLDWSAKSLQPGDIRRHFVEIPTYASALRVHGAIRNSRPDRVYLYAFDPSGRRYGVDGSRAYAERDTPIDVALAKPLVQAGVWEFVFYAPHDNPGAVSYEASLELYGLDVSSIQAFTVPTAGSPDGFVTVVNNRPVPFFGRATGEIDGFARDWSLDIDQEQGEYTFTTDASTEQVQFHFEMDEFTYARMTDVSIVVTDSADAPVAKSGFSQSQTVLSFRPPSAGTYTLAIRPAYTQSADDAFAVSVRERWITRAKVGVTTSGPSTAELALYPNLSVDVDVTLSTRPAQVPDGFEWAGELRFVDARGHVWLHHPLRIRP